ncbi:MAG TPA: hypothetical protein VN930_11225 [Xanthobacteraceae bacterium]|nr:hypothetical protein [Xanthobacteraceae bacterium]
MTDYQPLLKRALTGLDNITAEGRRSVYERARHALVSQLRTVTPPLAEADITRERLALEEAIRRVEADAAAAAAPAPVAQAPAAAPVAPQAPVQPQAPIVTPTRLQPQAPIVTPPPIQPQAPVPPVQTWPQPSAPAQARQAELQPQVPVPPQPAPAPRGPVAAPAAASPRVAARSAPMPRARIEPASGIRPAPPQARAPMPAGMESARRPVVSEPRAPVSGIDLDSVPAEPADFRQPPPLPAMPPQPSAARPPRPRTAEVARADRRKALRAKLVVGGIVVVLLVVAVGLGYVHRDRILAFLHMGPAVVADADRPKAVDRVASDPNVARPVQPVPAGSVAAVAQRAVLYEENPGATPQQQQQLFVGTAVWRTETVTLGPGRPPEIGIRVDIDIPDRRMNVVMTIRRNPDTTLPASHTVEIQFATPGDAFGGVANMPGIRAKGSEAAQGAPLAGLVVRVTPGFFLIGLSNMLADRDRNMGLLRERPWMDIPFVYNNGRRAVIAIEKGTPGERVVNEALAAWGL